MHFIRARYIYIHFICARYIYMHFICARYIYMHFICARYIYMHFICARYIYMHFICKINVDSSKMWWSEVALYLLFLYHSNGPQYHSNGYHSNGLQAVEIFEDRLQE